MLLKIYNSKSDMYGNSYYYVELTHLGKLLTSGTIAANNINTWECKEVLQWEVCTIELPIREFNRLTKNAPYLGCTWADIKENILNGEKNVSSEK